MVELQGYQPASQFPPSVLSTRHCRQTARIAGYPDTRSWLRSRLHRARRAATIAADVGRWAPRRRPGQDEHECRIEHAHSSQRAAILRVSWMLMLSSCFCGTSSAQKQAAQLQTGDLSPLHGLRCATGGGSRAFARSSKYIPELRLDASSPAASLNLIHSRSRSSCHLSKRRVRERAYGSKPNAGPCCSRAVLRSRAA